MLHICIEQNCTSETTTLLCMLSSDRKSTQLRPINEIAMNRLCHSQSESAHSSKPSEETTQMPHPATNHTARVYTANRCSQECPKTPQCSIRWLQHWKVTRRNNSLPTTIKERQPTQTRWLPVLKVDKFVKDSTLKNHSVTQSFHIHGNKTEPGQIPI